MLLLPLDYLFYVLSASLLSFFNWIISLTRLKFMACVLCCDPLFSPAENPMSYCGWSTTRNIFSLAHPLSSLLLLQSSLLLLRAKKKLHPGKRVDQIIMFWLRFHDNSSLSLCFHVYEHADSIDRQAKWLNLRVPKKAWLGRFCFCWWFSTRCNPEITNYQTQNIHNCVAVEITKQAGCRWRYKLQNWKEVVILVVLYANLF